MFDGRFGGVPSEGRALDAHGKLAHPGEDGHLAQGLVIDGRVRVRGHHLLELLKQFDRLVGMLALEGGGHQRSRGFGNGAARPLKANVGNPLVGHVEIDVQVIAAQGIVALLRAIGLGQLAEVARIFVVVEDDLLVQFAKLSHR